VAEVFAESAIDISTAATDELDSPAEEPLLETEDSAPAAEEPGTGLTVLEFEEPTEAMIAAVMGQDIEVRREQLQLQIAQLAAPLRERLREVDRREARLNARAGELEADLRASRMWLSERELEFQERESDLTRKIEELQGRVGVRESEFATTALDIEAR